MIRCPPTEWATGFARAEADAVTQCIPTAKMLNMGTIGRYGVDTIGFEEFLGSLGLMNPDVEMIVIDEIGKMELFSNRFRRMVRDALNSDKQVLASIPIERDEFIREIKKRLDIQIFEVTHRNRDHLPDEIVEGL